MSQPRLFTDPRVAALALQCDAIARKVDGLRSALHAYADAHVSEEGRAPLTLAPLVPALRHHAMTDRSLCGCDVCDEWRSRRDEFTASLRFVPEGHKWSVCACQHCRFAGRLQLNFVAATNVRDLLIEMSYHANFHSRHGVRVMQWLETELRRPQYTVDWCAYQLSRRPVDEWLIRCEKALSPIVSGVVFNPGDGELDEPFAMRVPQVRSGMVVA